MINDSQGDAALAGTAKIYREALPQILTDPAVSTLVATGDVEALGTAIAAFVTAPPDPVQTRALAERYSWEETVAMLSDVFQRALP